MYIKKGSRMCVCTHVVFFMLSSLKLTCQNALNCILDEFLPYSSKQGRLINIYWKYYHNTMPQPSVPGSPRQQNWLCSPDGRSILTQPPVHHSDTTNLWGSVSSCMQIALSSLRVCYTALWCSISSSSKRCRHLAEKGSMQYPSTIFLIRKGFMQNRFRRLETINYPMNT